MNDFTHCELCGKDFKSYRSLASHLKQKHPDISTKEYYDRFYKKPGEGICPVCGKSTNFIGRLNRGYSPHCSWSCASKEPNIIKQKKQSTLLSFGNENYRNVEQAKQTKLERYGDENYNNSEKQPLTKLSKTKKEINASTKKSWETRKLRNNGKWLSDKSLNSTKQTKLKKYGSKNYNNRHGACQTCLKKYGCSNAAMTLESIKKRNKTRHDSQLKQDRIKYKNYIDIINIDHAYIIGYCKKCNKNFKISKQTLKNRIKTNLEICLNCNPLWSTEPQIVSKSEKELCNYIKTIYNGQVLENDRTVIYPKEIDIYLPELRLGFEFDGTYWHADPDFYKADDIIDNIETAEEIWEKDRQKDQICESAGIMLIRIKEYPWLTYQKQLKHRIKRLLNIQKTINNIV